MGRRRRASKQLRDGQVAIWAVELVYPDPPLRQGKIVQGSGKTVLHQDGTVCIDGSPARWTDEWGRPFYLRLSMRLYEDVGEIVEKDPHLIGALAG